MLEVVTLTSTSTDQKGVPTDAFLLCSNLLVVLVIIVMLECRLQAWLRRVLGIGRDFFAVVLFSC